MSSYMGFLYDFFYKKSSKQLVDALIETVIQDWRDAGSLGPYGLPRPIAATSQTESLLSKIEYKTIEFGDLNHCYDLSDLSHNYSDLNIPTKQTLLTLSARYSSPKVFARILSHPDMDPNVPDGAGDTPLHIAAKLGRTRIASQLIEHPHINVLQENGEGETAYALSCSGKDKALQEMLLKASGEQENAASLQHLRNPVKRY